MSKVVRNTLVGGLLAGGLSTAGIFMGLSIGTSSEADQMADIEACAEYLNDTVQPVADMKLPEVCSFFDLGDYYLPPRQEFIDTESANITSDEDQRVINLKISLGVGGMGFLVGAVVGGVSRRRTEEVEKIIKSSPGSLVI